MEELVKRLREVADEVDNDYDVDPYNAEQRCLAILQAADAIEQLSADLERSKDYEAFWEKEANEALKKFQTAVANKPRWIPTTERLPEEDGCYLVAVKNDHKRRYSKTAWFSHNSWFARQDVTHWMPLPEPPMVEEERA